MAGGMQGVTLDEGGAEADRADAPAPRRRWSTRRRLLVAAGALGVVALAVVGTQRVLDARHDAADRAVADRYAGAQGVVEPFDASLHAEPGPDPGLALESTARVGGTVVGLQRDGSGWHVVGLDADDSSTLWSTGVDLVVASPDDRPYWLEDGYSPYGLLAQAGVPGSVARAVACGIGLVVLVAAWRRCRT